MLSKQIKKKKITRSIFYAHCKHCGKYLESEHLNQLVWNLDVHQNNCKQNKDKDKNEE